jgi:outer membrane protein
MSDSFGRAVRAGADIDPTRQNFLNLDIEYIDMRTRAALNTTAIGAQTVNVSINPIVAGIGPGVRF